MRPYATLAGHTQIHAGAMRAGALFGHEDAAGSPDKKRGFFSHYRGGMMVPPRPNGARSGSLTVFQTYHD